VRSGATDAPLVLFVCRHGAARSVLAAAELDRLAKAAGVAVDARAAGIEPGATVGPAVIAALPDAARKHVPPPRRVRADDVARAWLTVTFDLEASDLPGQPRACERWDGLPTIDNDAAVFVAALTPRAEALLRQLDSRQSSAGR
jgi:arsenate reductase